MTTEQKNALSDQIEIHKKRLKLAGTELQKEGIQQLISDLEKKLLEAIDDRGAIEILQAVVDKHTAELEKVKKNPSSMVVLSDKDGRPLKTKGDVDIEGFEKSIADHKAQIEKLKAKEKL